MTATHDIHPDRAAGEGGLTAEEKPEVRVVHDLTLALEFVDRARGHLLAFHHLIGHADNALDDVLQGLDEAARADLAALVRRELVGRDVLFDRWTYELLDEFDDGFWAAWRETEQRVRAELTGGRRHVHESALQKRRRGADAGDG